VPLGATHDHAKDSCAICDLAIDGAPLTDPQTGSGYHPRCAVERLPQDAVVRLLGVLALVVVPSVLVWAG
jgi:hypothetical protein